MSQRLKFAPTPINAHPLRLLLQELAFFPALTLLVFIRKSFGVRIVRPVWIIGLFFALEFYASFGVALMHGRLIDMQATHYFAITFAVVATFRYFGSSYRWRRGDRVHSLSSGVSYLENHRVPRFLHHYRRIYRFLDPLYGVIIGGYAWIISHALGLWIFFASFSLKIFEEACYERAVERDLDIADSLCEGEAHLESVEHYTTRRLLKKARRSRSHESTGVLPAGIGPDIEEAIARRKARH